MLYRELGTTGVRISALALGAGPVPGVMTGADAGRQRAIVERALAAGINWFDTAATYGNGLSEASLGTALRDAGSHEFHVATKVRLLPDELDDIPRRVVASLQGSLQRLGVPRVTLLQVHNSITAHRGDEPTSLTPHDVLGRNGLLPALRRLRDDGLVAHLGLTGIGQPGALREVIDSGEFAAIQLPYHLLNPSAGQTFGPEFPETNYGNIIAACAAQRMGILAIRVFAGGALVGQPPSAHTHQTKFFPLDLYERDTARALRYAVELSGEMTIDEAALRFVYSHWDITGAIVGFSEPAHVDRAVECLECGPLPEDLLARLRHLAEELP